MFVIDMMGGITWKLSQLRFNTFSTLVLGLATLRYKLLYTLSGKTFMLSKHYEFTNFVDP